MLCQQKGVLSGSDFYFFTPSVAAKDRLFYFTSLGHFFCDFGYRVEREEDYGNYLLLLVKEGKLMVSGEGKTAMVKAGDMAFLNCHIPHGYYAVGFTEFLWVHFDGANTGQFYKDIIGSLGGRQVFCPDYVENIERKMREIISNCRYEKVSTEFDHSLNIYELLIELSKNIFYSGQRAEVTGEKFIEEALQFIKENLYKELSIGMIANHVGMSESHFARSFRKVMNSSPKEYIIRRRLNEAKCLLKTTPQTIKEIAFYVGFNSESHFINTFTAQNGLSPKKFREFPL